MSRGRGCDNARWRFGVSHGGMPSLHYTYRSAQFTLVSSGWQCDPGRRWTTSSTSYQVHTGHQLYSSRKLSKHTERRRWASWVIARLSLRWLIFWSVAFSFFKEYAWESKRYHTPTVAVGSLEGVSSESIFSDILTNHHFSGPSSSGGSNTYNKTFLPATDSLNSNINLTKRSRGHAPTIDSFRFDFGDKNRERQVKLTGKRRGRKREPEDL